MPGGRVEETGIMKEGTEREGMEMSADRMKKGQVRKMAGDR